MIYASVPSDKFVQDFTAQKQYAWGVTATAIDDYIRQQILDHITLAAGVAPAALKVLNSQQYHANLKTRIDGEVNRGLAIIAHAPDVQIFGVSPYGIIDAQTFAHAMRQLIFSFLNVSKEQCRLRVNRSVVWADACAYRIMEATAKRLVRR
jgi:hypothetical protein